MSRISILTPYKNAEKYIRETAESILDQLYSDWEWILVNDHSSENELEAISDLIKDPRILVLENKGNGIVDALCTALEHATVTYVTRMDADDLMPLYKLKRMIRFIQNKPQTIVTGKVSYFTENGSISEGYLKYQEWLNNRVEQQDFYAKIYRECTVASGNWLMRRADLEQCGGFRNLNYPEDYDLLFRWYENGFNIVGMDLVLHWWREHEQRTSKNSVNYQQEAFFRLKINRFIQLDLNVNQYLIVNGTGQKGRLTAKNLLDLKVLFTWISHEAEKFSKGLLNHAILDANQLKNVDQAQILNTTLIEEDKLKELYKNGISEMTFYTL